MLRETRWALLAAGACLAGLVATGWFAYVDHAARVRDAAGLAGFATIQGNGLDGLMTRIVHFADPGPFLLFGLAIVAYAWFAGRRRTAFVLGVLLLAAPITTELLKHALAHDRPGGVVTTVRIGRASWPSGHTTGAMTLALAATLAAPVRVRAVVAGVGLLFSLAVGYSVVAMVWHYPSDVLGALFVAAGWAFLAVAVLRLKPDPVRPENAARGDVAGLGVLVLGVAAGLVLLVAHEGPHRVLSHARGQTTALVIACVLAALAAILTAAFVRAARPT
jgi:membrane-associated phospholipid phosphatase